VGIPIPVMNPNPKCLVIQQNIHRCVRKQAVEANNIVLLLQRCIGRS